jgi:hypothetical protein
VKLDVNQDNDDEERTFHVHCVGNVENFHEVLAQTRGRQVLVAIVAAFRRNVEQLLQFLLIE